jgi:hypothetical protein
MATISPTATCDMHRVGYLKGTVYICFVGCKHWNACLFYGNKQDTGCDNICCMIWKVCAYKSLPSIFTFIPVHRKANYTGDEGYHPISLMSLMQKTMKKLVTRNIRRQSKGHVPHIYNHLPTNQGTPQKLQRTMWIHLYRKKWKTEVIVELS